MKGINIINHKLVPDGYSALTCAPFIFYKSKKAMNNKRIVNHENIHIRQQVETLWIGFLLIYLLNYVINLFILKQHKRAYKRICFENECYKNMRNLEYLKKRRLFAFVNYF